jgi:hypothetical protein
MTFNWILATALIGFGSLSAFAAETGRTQGTFPKMAPNMTEDYIKPHVGVFAGLANPEASFDTSVEYGLDVGFQPWSPIGIGFELSGLGTDRMQGSTPQDLNRTNILVKGTYNLGGSIPVVRYSYLGLGLGAVVDSSAYRGTHTGIAPLLGFDIPLTSAPSQFFSLGAAAKYVFVSGPSPDGISVNGMAKYWF